MKAVSDFKKGETNAQSPNKSRRELTSEENQIFTQRRLKLTQIIDRTAYCIEEVRKHYNKINYQSFVNILNTNRFVADSIGVSVQEFDMLVQDRYIDLSLFSLYVECDS
jgi:mevalonate kinase